MDISNIKYSILFSSKSNLEVLEEAHWFFSQKYDINELSFFILTKRILENHDYNTTWIFFFILSVIKTLLKNKIKV